MSGIRWPNAGHEEALRHHTFEHRAEYMCNLISRHLPQRTHSMPPIARDKLRAYAGTERLLRTKRRLQALNPLAIGCRSNVQVP